MTDDLYYGKLESTSTTDLVDMIREKDKRIIDLEQKLEQAEKDLADYQFNYPTIKELQKENAELKEALKGKRCNCMTYLNFKDLEKEIAELKEQHEVSARNMSSFIESLSKSENEAKKQLSKAKELLKRFIETSNPIYFEEDRQKVKAEAEQFLKDKTEQEEPYYVIVNMNCQYEICRKCPKSGLFKGTYEECEKWIKEKLREVEK